MSYLVLTLGNFVLGDIFIGDFVLWDFVQKYFCPRELCPKGFCDGGFGPKPADAALAVRKVRVLKALFIHLVILPEGMMMTNQITNITPVTL